MDRVDLIFSYNSSDLSEFLNRVKETGGWPDGYEYLQFHHAVETKDMYCSFTDDPRNTEMWTTICCADDYYEFMLSPERIRKIERRGCKQLLDKLSRLYWEEKE